LLRAPVSLHRPVFASSRCRARRDLHSFPTRRSSDLVPSGFTALDRITSGWQPSDLIIIAARPAMGKTAFVLTCARNAAVQYDKPDRKSTRLNSSHVKISYAVFCLKKKND